MNLECIHLMDPGTCSICIRGRTSTGRLIADEPEATMRSRYDSRCLRCDGHIDVGDEIGLHQGIWIHLSHFDGSVL